MTAETRSSTGSLAAWYHQFWLGGDDWDLETATPLEARMFNHAANGEGVLVLTGTHSGWVTVTLRFSEEAPLTPPDEWEDVVRGVVHLPDAAVFAMPTGSLGDEIELTLPAAGDYQFQIAAKGREDLDHDEDDSPEVYLIDLWPAARVDGSTVLRITSEFGQLDLEGL